MAACVVLFALALGCGALLAGEALPDNPIADATDFDADTLTQLLESDENEAVYVPVPVASSDTNSEENRDTDSGVNEEPPPPEEQEPPEEEEEPEPEMPKTTPVANPNSAAANANVGGSETGGNSENGQSTDKVYFTTTIKDGETVTNPTYDFKITHKYPELTVKTQEVFVNNSLVPQFRGSVTLAEGENTIRVKVSYTDADGKGIGPVFKDYKVTLDSKSLVINTTAKDETVAKDQYTFTASASYLGKTVPVTVTCNGSSCSKVKGSADSYRVRLKVGANTIVITAESGELKKEATFTVTYNSDGIFDFDIYLSDGSTVANEGTVITTEERFVFEVWMQNSADGVKFTANHGQTALNGKDLKNGGYRFTVSALTFGNNRISVTARLGDQEVTKRFTVDFQRPQAGPDNPNPDPEHAPSVSTSPDLSGGYTTNNSTFTLDVTGYNYLGQRLHGGKITLKLNGTEIKAGWQNENATTYRLNLVQPENQVTIFIVDEYGYSRYFDYTLYYEQQSSDTPIGYVTVSVEAPTVGLGWLIEPTSCPIYDNVSFAYVLEELLKANGFTPEFTGNMEQYYLAGISKPGLTDHIAIPETLQEAILAANKEITAPKPDSLEQKYITPDSGWLYSIDGLYPNYGFGTYYPRDGQCICLRFSLLGSGSDIGANDTYELPEIFLMQE